MPNTYGYVRVSTLEQVQGTSLAEQQRKIQGMALMHGQPVTQIFSDSGISGATPLSQRPTGQILLKTLQPGDTLIAAKLDRIFRSAADALNMVDLFKRNDIALIIVDIGTDPVTQYGTSKMFFGILACVAEFERSRIKERQLDGIKSKRNQNGYLGGKIPFGFQVIGHGKEAFLQPIPHQQAAIELMQKMSADGESLRSIAAAMQQHGIRISHVGVQNVLKRKSRHSG